jgi:hypothetical protein
MKLIIFSVVLISCSHKIPNYQATSKGYIIYRYTKPGEPVKEILRNGDTLVTEGDNRYFRYKNLIKLN